MASVLKSDNIINVLIGKSVARTASAQAYDSTNSTTFLADGEILVLDSTGVELTPGKTVADSEWIQIVQGRGANVADGQTVVRSARIYGKDLLSATAKSYSAGQEQISCIGFNGTSGSIVVSGIDTDTPGFVYVTPRTTNGVYITHKLQRIYQYSVAAASATQSGAAATIAETINSETNRFYKAEILASSTTTGANDTTIAVTNGSTVITGTLTNTLAAASVGDFVKLGASAGATVPAYKIAAMETGKITLTMPYQGTTGSVTCYHMTNANLLAGNMGVKLTGIAFKWSLGFFDYDKSRFDVQVNSNFGTTTLTRSQEASLGNGDYRQVAELERFSYISEGALMQGLALPKDAGRADYSSSATYDTIALEFNDTSDLRPISGTKPAKQLLYIFLVDGAAQGTNILNSLNPWIESCDNKFNTLSLV